jgi:hypothetical protein
MGLLESVLICVGLFLLFPKGFKYLVGTWMGAITGGFLWGLFIGGLFIAGQNPSWSFMGWSFVGFILAGVIGGLFLAANG